MHSRQPAINSIGKCLVPPTGKKTEVSVFSPPALLQLTLLPVSLLKKKLLCGLAMLVPRKTAPLLAFAAFGFIILVLHSAVRQRSWRDIPQVVGLGEVVAGDSPAFEIQSPASSPDDATQTGNKQTWKPRPSFLPGVPPSPGHNYTKVLVIPKVRDEKTDWIHEEMPDLQTAIYVADDPSAPLHPPKNKGNEVMIYLSYIIDHYEDLPDIIMFMHSHRFSWHNNDILNSDAYEIITRLSSERVVREGYMNLRCHWNPGCPDWIHPGHVEVDGEKKEERELARVWSELFPLDPIPQILAQPCCGQFALSRERVHAIPKTKFSFYRDWLMRTDLPNYLSGRVWEYLWQYIFTGKNAFCPDQHVCYCDGYGVCFENEQAFDHWFELRWKTDDLERELEAWHSKAKLIEDAAIGVLDEANDLEVPEVGKDATLEHEIQQNRRQLDEQRDDAINRGNDPQNRAAIAGREWHDGDWY